MVHAFPPLHPHRLLACLVLKVGCPLVVFAIYSWVQLSFRTFAVIAV